MGEWGFTGVEAFSREQVTSLLYAILFVLLLFAAFKRSWGGAISTVIGFAFVLIFVQNENSLKSLSDQLLAILTLG